MPTDTALTLLRDALRLCNDRPNVRLRGDRLTSYALAVRIEDWLAHHGAVDRPRSPSPPREDGHD